MPHRARDGVGGTQERALLAAAAGQFDVFLTSDQNLAFQQNLPALPLAVIALVAPSNDIDDLRPLMPRVLDVLPTARPGHLIQVGA